MEGIVFYVTKTFKEVAKTDEFILLEHDTHYYLLNEEGYFDRDLTKEFIQVDLLLNLNRRSKKKFNVQEMNELIQVCETLLNNYTKDTKEEQEVREFIDDLKDLCHSALSMGKFVFAAGTESNLFH